MYHIQEIIRKVKGATRRRKKLLIFVPIFFVGLSLAALYFMEPTYESSTTFLVEQPSSSNMNVYDMGGNTPQRNRLRALEKIVMSRSAMQMVMDSLGLDDTLETMSARQSMIEGLRQSVTVSAEPNNSFSITVTSSDPVQARDMARLLSNHFINTQQQLESRRSSETVEFLQGKLEEMNKMLTQQRSELMNQRTQQMEQVAENPETLQRSLESTNQQIQQLDLQIHQVENRLSIIDDFLNQEGDMSVQPLHRLSLSEVPNGEELMTLMSQYDTLNQRYTENYPQLSNTKSQITEVTRRIRPAVQNNLNSLQSQRSELESKREQIMNDLERSYIASEQSSGDRSTYSIYQELTASIKKRLEQARINQEMDNMASMEYEVLDRPYVSQEPVSPNKRLVVGAGLGLGLLVSCLLAGFAEMLDTTIRREEDLKLKKPVIAYLKDGRQ